MIRPLLTALALSSLVLAAPAQERLEEPSSSTRQIERQARSSSGSQPGRAGEDAAPLAARDLQKLRERFQKLDPEQRREFLRRLKERRGQADEGRARQRRSPEQARRGGQKKADRGSRSRVQREGLESRRGSKDARSSRGSGRGSSLRERLRRMDPASRRALIERMKQSRAGQKARPDRERGRSGSARGQAEQRDRRERAARRRSSARRR